MENKDKTKKSNLTILVISIVALLLIGSLVYFANKSTEDKAKNEAKTSQTEASSEENVDYEKVDLPQLSDEITSDEAAVKMVTTEGDITIKLFPKYAPLASENFLTHAKKGYYNDNEFYRVVENFMIQAGDPTNQGSGGQSIWKGKDKGIDSGTGFKNEYSPNLYNIRGALSMANAGPNTNGSQFFIVQNKDDVSDGMLPDYYPTKIIDAYKHGGFPGSNTDKSEKNYTVFGQVISGMDVVDKIAAGETEDNPSNPSEKSKPVNPVKIKKIEIIKDYDFTK